MAEKSLSGSPEGLIVMAAIILSIALWFSAKNGASAETADAEPAPASCTPTVPLRAPAVSPRTKTVLRFGRNETMEPPASRDSAALVDGHSPALIIPCQRLFSAGQEHFLLPLRVSPGLSAKLVGTRRQIMCSTEPVLHRVAKQPYLLPRGWRKALAKRDHSLVETHPLRALPGDLHSRRHPEGWARDDLVAGCSISRRRLFPAIGQPEPSSPKRTDYHRAHAR